MKGNAVTNNDEPMRDFDALFEAGRVRALDKDHGIVEDGGGQVLTFHRIGADSAERHHLAVGDHVVFTRVACKHKSHAWHVRRRAHPRPMRERERDLDESAKHVRRLQEHVRRQLSSTPLNSAHQDELIRNLRAIQQLAQRMRRDLFGD